MNESSERASTAAEAIARDAVLFAFLTRAALAVIVWLSLRAVPRLPLYPAQLPDNFLPDHPFLDGWARWDAAHYVAVARYGYGDPASPSPDGGIGFFPLYPLLMRAIGFITGQSDSSAGQAVIGIAISNVCFLASVWLFARLAIELVPIDEARWAGRLFALAPFAYFYNAAYTESLFVVEILGAVWFARRDQWWRAALMAALASATRLVGLAVIGGLLYGAWRARKKLPELIGLAAVGASGFFAFLIYLWIRFDDPLAYFETQEEWGDWGDHVWFYVELFLTRPREALGGDPRHLVIIGNVALALVCMALMPTVLRRFDPTIAGITVLLVIGQFAITWVSLGRYLMPAIGIYFAAALLVYRDASRAWLRDGVLAGSAIIMSGLAILYAHGFWVI